MIDKSNIREEELEDFNYLYTDFSIDEFKEEEAFEDIEDITEIKNINLENIDFIKNIKIKGDDDNKLSLDKKDINDLDEEGLTAVFDEELWKEMNFEEVVPQKVLYTEEEKAIVAEENMGLVKFTIKPFCGANQVLDFDDLFGIGLIGYTKAINTFDKSKNIKFSTYAIKCIRNEIFHTLRKENKHAKNNIHLETIISMDKNGNSLTIEDSLSREQILSENFKTLEDLMLEEENKEILLKAIRQLKEDEQYILIYRFGLDKGIVKTQKEIAEMINMSQANVSKMQKNSLEKLKLILKKEMFEK